MGSGCGMVYRVVIGECNRYGVGIEVYETCINWHGTDYHGKLPNIFKTILGSPSRTHPPLPELLNQAATAHNPRATASPKRE